MLVSIVTDSETASGTTIDKKMQKEKRNHIVLIQYQNMPAAYKKAQNNNYSTWCLLDLGFFQEKSLVSF